MFKDGEIVEAEAGKDNQLFQQMIEVDGQLCLSYQTLAAKLRFKLEPSEYSVLVPGY